MAEAIDPISAVATSIRHWSRLADLATFATNRHGFGDTDGGFGVTYPGDLDEYDHAVGVDDIPSGYIEVYGLWGAPRGDSLLVRESLYLELLAGILAEAGFHAEAAQVRAAQVKAAEG
jgi:hypothetical protein